MIRLLSSNSTSTAEAAARLLLCTCLGPGQVCTAQNPIGSSQSCKIIQFTSEHTSNNEVSKNDILIAVPITLDRKIDRQLRSLERRWAADRLIIMLQKAHFLKAGALAPVMAMLHRGPPRLQEVAAHTLAALTDEPVSAVAMQLASPEVVQDLAAMLHMGSFSSRYWAATCLTRLVVAQRQANGAPDADAGSISEVRTERDE